MDSLQHVKNSMSHIFQYNSSIYKKRSLNENNTLTRKNLENTAFKFDFLIGSFRAFICWTYRERERLLCRRPCDRERDERWLCEYFDERRSDLKINIVKIKLLSISKIDPTLIVIAIVIDADLYLL